MTIALRKNSSNKGSCGTPLEYDIGLMEHLDNTTEPACKIVRGLVKPSSRMYIRVNTLKVNVDYYLKLLSSFGLEFYRDEEIPEALWAPIEGPFKIDIYDKIVLADKRASESVMLGSNLYAPGVLYSDNISPGDTVTVYSPNGVPVGSGVAVVSSSEALKTRRGLFIKITNSQYKAPIISELPGYNSLVYGQSITSMYVAKILDPKPGELIIDMTAAPGGKVSHIAQLVGPKSTIIAIDRRSKVEKLKETLSKLGLDFVKVIAGDSRYASTLLGSLSGHVDAVIIDPPCTDLGVIPKIYDKKTLRDSIVMSEYQRQFIREAYKILKPGGRLVYSTCTLTLIENEKIVEYALSIGFKLEDPEYKPRRGLKTSYGYRFYPHIHDTPGFYVSLLLVK